MTLATAPGAIASLGVQAPSFSRKAAFVWMAWFALRAFDMGMRSTARQNRPRG